jgi:hypothetical protein
MATNTPYLIDGVANGTISKGQFCKYASGGWVACSAITDQCDGIAYSDAVAGGGVAMQVGGKVTFLCGGTGIADGAKIGPTAGGLGQTAVTTQYPRLKAYGAVAANAYGEALWHDDNVVTP